MTRSADLIDEVHILRREHEKLELEKRIAELKAEPTIDEGCVGCCKVVDVAAKLQKELEDTGIKLVGCRNLIDDRDRIIREMDVTISDLMDNDRRLNRFLDEYRLIIDNRDKTIESLTTKYDGKCAYICGCEEELDVYRQDSKVLKKVVDEVKEWGDATSDPSSYTRRTNAVTLDQIATIVKDYLEAPEEPPIDEPPEATVMFAFLELP